MPLSSEEIAEIYERARSLLPAAKAFGRQAKIDPVTAEEILMEAADRVAEALQKGNSEIHNLPAYLFTTYKHLILARVRENQREQSLTVRESQSGEEASPNDELELLPDPTDYYQKIETKILVDEIVRHMDEQTRFIFNHLLLDRTYKEIAVEFRKAFNKPIKENALRSKFSKAVDRLTRELSDK